MNLYGLIANQARYQPGKVALIEGVRALTYGELDRLTGQYATELKRLGVRAGDRVASLLKERSEHVLLLLAVERIGGVAVVLDWRAPPVEQQRIVDSLGFVLQLLEPDMEPLPGIAAAVIGEGWNRHVATHAPAPMHEAGPEDPARIALSSGTTGAPKGAVTTQRQMHHRFVAALLAFGWSAEDRYLACVPFCYSPGRGYLHYILELGGTVVLMPTIFTPGEYVAMVERHDITAGLLTATPLRWLLDHRGVREPLLPGVQRLATVGAQIHAEEKAALYRRVVPGLIEAFSTSATGILTRLAGEDLVNRGDSMGRILPIATLEAVDDAGNALPVGAGGVLRIRGPGTSTKIIGDDGGDGPASLREDWYYPGDLVRIDGDGYLHLQGRSADLIIRGGVNVYPAEIERVLLAHPGVAEAAVVGWPSRVLGEEVAAFIRPRGPLELGELRALCLERLVSYKVPRGFFLVEELPRNSAGKVRKAALAAGLTPL